MAIIKFTFFRSGFNRPHHHHPSTDRENTVGGQIQKNPTGQGEAFRGGCVAVTLSQSPNSCHALDAAEGVTDARIGREVSLLCP